MKSARPRNWIVVADGARARVLLNAGRMEGVRQMPDATFHDSHPPSRELGSERPPRVHESFGSARHAIEPRSDPHEQRKERFLLRLALFLQDAWQNKAFDCLILVAPATALGHLRDTLAPAVRKTVIAEYVHDYSHQDNETVYQNVKDSLPL